MKPETGSRRRISHAETLALWKKYRETNDQQVRNRLVLTFAPLVKYIVYNKIRELSASDATSLNTLVLSDDETDVERIDTIASQDRTLDPERAALAEAAKQRFRRAFASLPAREREVAVLLYVKNLTLREVGEILEVSESRVCQIHSELKRKLKKALSGEAGLFSEVA